MPKDEAPAGKVRFGVYLKPEVRQALLIAALEDRPQSGQSATQVVEELIEAWLKKRRKPKPKGRRS